MLKRITFLSALIAVATLIGCNGGGASIYYVQGFNDKKGLACIQDADYLAGDVLVVRRAATDRETDLLVEDVVYLQTSRIQGTLFLPGPGCTARAIGDRDIGRIKRRQHLHGFPKLERGIERLGREEFERDAGRWHCAVLSCCPLVSRLHS